MFRPWHRYTACIHSTALPPWNSSTHPFSRRLSVTADRSLVLSIDHTGDADVDIQHTETGHGLDGRSDLILYVSRNIRDGVAVPYVQAQLHGNVSILDADAYALTEVADPHSGDDLAGPAAIHGIDPLHLGRCDACDDRDDLIRDDDLTMLPIYIGVGDEANQGLCTGTENYWCVNKEASEDDINATLDFMYWCVSSDEGTKAMADDMGFVIPFKNAVESPNVFVKADKEMTAAGKTPVAWNFSTMPSENWKNGVGSALTAYAAGTGSWDDVVTAFVDGWASEAALNAAAESKQT